MKAEEVTGEFATLWPDEDRGCAASLIRHHAQRIIRVGGFEISDRDDLEQRLLIELWQRRSQFDPDRGPWCVFVTVVICNAASKILRKQFAERRIKKRTEPLNRRVRCDGESVEFVELISCDRRRVNDQRDESKQRDLAMDIASLVREFPQEWQTIVSSLGTQTVAEIAKEQRIPRAVIREIKYQVRKRFEKANVQRYS